MGRTVVIALSFGTVMVIGLSIAMLSIAIVLGAAVHKPSTPAGPTPTIWTPKTGAAGQLNEVKNELKYGPVNIEAAKEEKNGLFDRLRARRATRVCTLAVQSTTNAVCQPQALQAVCMPSVCIASTVQTAIVPPNPPSRTEYPALNPLDALEKDADCLPCQRPNPRFESKTGGFVCSQCRLQKVGDEWHTDWKDDGTPITFLCESCYRRMTVAQRGEAYKAYVKRQLASYANLSFQETAKVK